MTRQARYFAAPLAAIPLLWAGCAATGQRTIDDSLAAYEPRPSSEYVSGEESTAPGRDYNSTPSISPVSHLVPAEEPTSQTVTGNGGLTLAEIEQLALANNPAIQQATSAAARAGGIRTQVGLKPNPTVGYFGEEIGNEGAGGLHGAFVSQTFVRGDKLAWNRSVLDHDVNAMNWQVETQRQRVLTDVRVAFYNAMAAQERLRLAQRFREVAEKGVSLSQARLQAMAGARQNVLQSEIQVDEVILAIQQAEFDFQAAIEELSALAGFTGLQGTTLIGDLEVTLQPRNVDAEFTHIISNSPLLASAQARVDRARANMQRQRVQAVPNFTAQLGIGADDATGDGFANVQLSLPVPIHNRNQGNITAAHAEYCAALENVERVRMSIRRDLARAMREYQVAQATVHRYESRILPNANETLELMQQAQEAGEFDFLRVLTARRAAFDANMRYVTAKASLAQANAKIDGLLLSGGLSNVIDYEVGDDLRGQALSGS